MSDFPSQQQDKFVLRLPDGMRDRIKFTADANSRSMNAEIVSTLEIAYPADSEVDKLMTSIKDLTSMIGEVGDVDMQDKLSNRLIALIDSIETSGVLQKLNELPQKK